MIYEDTDIGIVAEYGHGSIFHVITERDSEGYSNLGLVSADPGEIGRSCPNWESLEDHTLKGLNPSITLRFKNKKSLHVLLKALQEIEEYLED